MTLSKWRQSLKRILKLLLAGELLLCRQKVVCQNGVHEENTKPTKQKTSSDTEVDGMTILEEALSREVIDVEEEIRKLNELRAASKNKPDNKALLEKCYQDNSLAGEARDSKANIQCTIDRIKEFARERKFYQLNQATQDVLNQIDAHQERFTYQLLGDEIFNSLQDALSIHKESATSVDRAANSLSDIGSFDENSSEIDLQRWAEHLELLADEIEDNLPFFPFEVFDNLEGVCEAIVLEARKKTQGEQRRKLTRRLRFAAGFILNLIEMEREKAVQEDERLLYEMELAGQEALDLIDGEDG